MNLIDGYVVEVLGKPREAYGKWWVDVRYDSYGRESTTAVMCDTKEEADKVEKGYTFLC